MRGDEERRTGVGGSCRLLQTVGSNRVGYMAAAVKRVSSLRIRSEGRDGGVVGSGGGCQRHRGRGESREAEAARGWIFREHITLCEKSSRTEDGRKSCVWLSGSLRREGGKEGERGGSRCGSSSLCSLCHWSAGSSPA